MEPNRACRRIAAGVGLLLAALASHALAADTIRRFPYPFGHMVTFASDVDSQAPWHGAAIHSLINGRLGLPVSDSLWVQGSSISASSLFLGALDLNDRPSGVARHTTFGLLLREWHRGNIDTFHSWQDDAVPPLSQRLAQPVKLAAASTIIPIVAGPELLASFHYRHLRLYFSSAPPADLSLRLHDKNSRTVTIGVAQVRAGLAVKPDPSAPPHMVEILVGVPPDVGTPVHRDGFDLFRLQRLELFAPSCAKECTVAIERIDRDGFSRRSVLLQLPVLAAFNIRPVMLTSHGGWSFVQNFDPEKYSLTMKRAAGSTYESELVPNVLRAMADERRSHAFHSDLLREFGVTTVWSYSRPSKHLWNEPVPHLKSTIPGFHDLVRTTVANYSSVNLEQFRRDIFAMERRLKNVAIDDIYCAKVCWGDQGAVVGLLLALSLARINAGEETDHLWYTHFASGDEEFKRSAEKPLRPSAVNWLEQLANHYYGYDRGIGPDRRAWVAPGGSVARYRLAHAQIESQVRVNPGNSRVDIQPWKDPVTGRLLPDAAAGTRDLHGITVYVPDSTRASLVIAGRETASFTRNGPDVSGRQSITIVDDSTPTTLLDEIPLAASGALEARGGEWSDLDGPRENPGRGRTFGILVAGGGNASVAWRPAQLNLWNTTHLQFAYRKIAGAGNRSTGRFFIELDLEDGGTVAAIEGPDAQDRAAKSLWAVPRVSPGTAWTHRVLAAAELAWPAGPQAARPALPLGRIREVRFGLLDAAPGERLEIDAVRALRPNGNNVAPDGNKLLGGQVTRSGELPGRRVVIEARDAGGKIVTTVTDRNGYYFFFGQKGDRVFSVAALDGARRCAPAGGQLVHLTRDEVELDIDLGRCR